MPFGQYVYRTIPMFNSYERAAEYEEKVVPIRGKGTNGGFKPVVSTRENGKGFNIRKEKRTIIVQLYGTDLLTYKPNKTVTITRSGWQSVTVNRTLTYLLGTEVRRYDNRTWINTAAGALLLQDGAKLRETEGRYGCKWEMIKPVFPVVHRVNRKELNRIRNKHKAFGDYLKGTLKLYDKQPVEKLETGVGRTYFLTPRKRWDPKRSWEVAGLPSVKQTLKLMDSGDTAEQYKVALEIMSLTATSEWVSPGRHITCSYSAAMKAYENFLKLAYRDSVFTPTEITSGKMIKDNYTNFFHGG
jgi:hypothetical protein